VALVPSAWRGWFDLPLAPWATLLVYAQSDPLEGLEWTDDVDEAGPAAVAARRCAGYAAYLTARYGARPLDVHAATIGGRPAVRATIRLSRVDFVDDTDECFADDIGPETAATALDDVVVEHAWVHAAGRTWHLYGLAPVHGPLQYLRATHEAIDSFECAA